MLVIYSKDTRTTILESKNVSYNVVELEPKQDDVQQRWRIEVEILRESTTGTNILQLNFLAYGSTALNDLQNMIDNAIM